MASINFEFLHDDDDGDRREEDSDGNQGDDDLGGDQDQDIEGQDEFLLTPTQRLDRYIHSENAFERQMVARTLLDGLRESLHDQEQTEGMLDHMSRLSADQEPMVRAELMEQIPHIAMLCHMNNSVVPRVVPERILPILVNYLRDNNNQVRKTSQAALLVLLEQGLLDNIDVNHQVCPVLEELTAFESVDDFRTEAVALMTRMASFLGPDVTENFFLPRFANFCCDTNFHVRKVCAANIGDMCSVVGRGATEEYLLPKFFYLCEDGVWGVRKACAECYMSVSTACSQGKRQTDLAPMFVQLLCDQSRWVRMAAFQQLGPFISTFADAEEKISENEDSSCLLAESTIDYEATKTSPLAAQEENSKETVNEKSNEETKLAELQKLAAVVGDLIDDDDKNDAAEEDYEFVDGRRVLKTLVVTNSALKSASTASSTDASSTNTSAADASTDASTDASSDVSYKALSSSITHSTTNVDSETPEMASTDPDGATGGGLSDFGSDLRPVPMEIDETPDSTDQNPTSTDQNPTSTDQNPASKDQTSIEVGSTESSLSEDISAEERRMRKQYLTTESDFSGSLSEENSASSDQTATIPDSATPVITVSAPVSVVAILTEPTGGSSEDDDDQDASKSSSELLSDYVAATSNDAAASPNTSSLTLNFAENYDQFNYWYIPPPVLDDPLLPADEKQPSSSENKSSLPTPSSALSTTSSDVADIPATSSSSESKSAPEDSNPSLEEDVGNVRKEMEALEIGEKSFQEHELEISQTFEIPPLAMSSPDREVDETRPSVVDAAANAKEDEDVEMADDDPVTDLFGDDEDGEPPLLLVSSKDEDGLTSRRGGSIGSYLDPLIEFGEEERRFQEQQQRNQELLQSSQQTIIPSDLLNYFLSMADPAKVQTVDTELTRHCAFSLPAVALTLGRKNWGCLRDIYETLASDMQWKVRYTLACSFHEMARIMGQEITSRDLLPIFDGFLKDLDEVRVGILKHLADFFELLLPKERRIYLQRIRDFMNCDNQRNWRFRLELANQLSPLACLFEPQDVADHLLPIAFELAFDRVAKVRLSSFRAMCACAKTFEFGIHSTEIGASSPTSSQSPSRSVPIPGNESLVKSFLASLVTRLATSPKWLDRQAFSIVSGLLLAQEAITQQHFDEYLLLPLCQLQSDKVANVRLTLARALATHVLTKPLFNSDDSRTNCIYGQELNQTIDMLKTDVDVDVQFCAHGGSKETDAFDLRASSDDEGDQFMSAEYH